MITLTVLRHSMHVSLVGFLQNMSGTWMKGEFSLGVVAKTQVPSSTIQGVRNKRVVSRVTILSLSLFWSVSLLLGMLSRHHFVCRVEAHQIYTVCMMISGEGTMSTLLHLLRVVDNNIQSLFFRFLLDRYIQLRALNTRCFHSICKTMSCQ